MAAGTAAIFPNVPATGFGKLTTANAALDGTGTVSSLFTAGANGARVDKIRLKALGTNVGTVVRIFLNNGSTNTVATNNSLISEMTLAATTASSTVANPDVFLFLDVALPPTYTLLATLGTTVAAGWQLTVEGGNY